MSLVKLLIAWPGTNVSRARRAQNHERVRESAVKQRGRERKGPPETIQKFRLRKRPISSADFPMTPMERTEHHFGPFWDNDFGAISGGPFFSRPLCFTDDFHKSPPPLPPPKTAFKIPNDICVLGIEIQLRHVKLMS